MKTTILLLFLALLTAASTPYRIIYIEGTIYNYKTGKKLKMGDVVNESDTLLMTSPKDYLSLYSKDKGRAMVNNPSSRNKQSLVRVKTSLPGKKIAQNEFAVQVGNNLNFGVSVARLTIRAGLISDLQDLRNYINKFSNAANIPMLVTDSLSIAINANPFAEEKDSRFFIMRYQYKGEQIDKKLAFGPVNAGELPIIIDRNIFTVDKKPVTPVLCREMQLIYYDSIKKTVTYVSPINLHFSNRQAVLESCKLLYPMLIEKYGKTNHHSETIKSELYNHIAENFGLIAPNDFEKIFKLLK